MVPYGLLVGEKDENEKRVKLVISIVNPLLSGKTYTFYVPLHVPQVGSTPFFTQLQALVDKLGKEVLSERDELATQRMRGGFQYSVPESVITLSGTPEKKFDAFLKQSPLLEKEWSLSGVMDEGQIKDELFRFIERLRHEFKLGFYTLVAPSLMKQKMISSSASELEADEHGVTLLRHSLPFAIQVKKKDNKENFRRIYDNRSISDFILSIHKTYEKGEEIVKYPIQLQVVTYKKKIEVQSSEEDAHFEDFLLEDFDNEEDVIAHFKRIPSTPSMDEEDCIRVKMTLKVEGGPSHELTVSHHPKQGSRVTKEDFIHLMLWQSALLYQSTL